jgi:hypothetical protein
MTEKSPAMATMCFFLMERLITRRFLEIVCAHGHKHLNSLWALCTGFDLVSARGQYLLIHRVSYCRFL